LLRVDLDVRRLGVAGAVLALVIACTLPGFHGLFIAHGHERCGALVDVEAESAHSSEVIPDGDEHRHDRGHCEVCRLIDLLPTLSGGIPLAIGPAWWVLEPRVEGQVACELVTGASFDARVRARGPPPA
jgi:hypothetical protein